MHLEVLHGVAEDGPEELGRGATSQHPTRRPQHIDYAVVGDGGGEVTQGREEEANGMLTQGENITGMGSPHRDVQREEEESEERENEEEHEVEIEDKDEEAEAEEVRVVEAREDFEVGGLAEEGDGRTVLVESENFVFRVRPEEIEFEL